MARRIIFQDEFEFKGQMKELTGGDSLFPDGAINHFRESNAIYARSLKHDPSDWIPEFKLMLTCNKLPHIIYDDPVICKRKNPSYYESEMEGVD